MTKVMIIGDVGGCADQLSQAVASAQADPDAVMIQVGDLIDRGPDSPGVLTFVRQRLKDPRRWIQLVGNHESQYLGAEMFWPQRLPDEDAALLKSWWLRDRLRVAAAVRTVDGEELLVTHAGLTVDAWRRLGEPVTAATTVVMVPDGARHAPRRRAIRFRRRIPESRPVVVAPGRQGPGPRLPIRVGSRSPLMRCGRTGSQPLAPVPECCGADSGRACASPVSSPPRSAFTAPTVRYVTSTYLMSGSPVASLWLSATVSLPQQWSGAAKSNT
ncbi:metallophosphoesterase [Micromonospora maris]|uniref:metallophosphoesterase n=1 Tax=Micromonospora maris TaxID=1003110 RepID=UPI000206BDCA|nr:metallophosphoesterase [Micromonospora maris]AEB45490.1 metallophosphoesterase [Micromonospora maris AB-18-032]